MNEKTLRILKSTLWFLVKLNLLAVPLYLIVTFGYSVPQLQDAWAAALDQSLKSLGYETAIDGNVIGVRSGDTIHQIEVSWDSTGWKSLYALTALVFASGVASLSGKMRFIAFGLPTMVFMNLLRIVTTIVFSLEFGFQWFDLVHGFLWGTVMVVFVVGMWYYLFFKK